MIDPKIQIVPVCGPVAIVSWGARICLDVQASDLPPEIAQLLPDRRQGSCWQWLDVLSAISRFMRRFRPIHLSLTCAVVPLRRLRALQQTLHRFDSSRLVACDAVRLRVMPEADIASDIEALVSLGLMTPDVALKHIDRQARIWGRLADSLRAKVVMARLGRQPEPRAASEAKDDPCNRTVLGPQMLVRDRGPRIGLNERPWVDAQGSRAEDGVRQVPEVITRFVEPPFDYRCARRYIRLGSLAVVGYTPWCLAVSRTSPVSFDHFCYEEIDALLLPIGCASAWDAARCIEECHPFDGKGWERVAALQAAWRDARQAIQNRVGTSWSVRAVKR